MTRDEVELAVHRWLLAFNSHLGPDKRRGEGEGGGQPSTVPYNEAWVAWLEKPKNRKYAHTDRTMRYLVFWWLPEHFPGHWRMVNRHYLRQDNAEAHIHEVRRHAYEGRKNVVLMREVDLLDEAVELLAKALMHMKHEPHVQGEEEDHLTPRMRKERSRQSFRKHKRRGLNDKTAVDRVSKELNITSRAVYLHTRDLREPDTVQVA